MRRLFAVVVPVALLATGSTACATKKFVRGEIGQVNEKVEGLSGQLEETQERVRQNEARINEVDQRAQAAATEARNAANSAAQKAEAVGAKADALEKASRRLVFEVVLSEDQGGFRFGRTDLPDSARARIDELIQQLKQDPKGVYIEIEGHTDSVGPEHVNDLIGLERAEAVKRYLYETHQVPLHKISVISYGEKRPIAPNNTREGRAQNRRVVIKLLA